MQFISKRRTAACACRSPIEPMRLRSINGIAAAASRLPVAIAWASMTAACAFPLHPPDAIKIAEETAKVERAREMAHRRLESKRRLAGEYQKRNRRALSVYETRDDELPPARSRRAYIHASQPPHRAVAGFASGGKKIAVHFSKVPLRVAVGAFAALTDANVVVAEEIAGEMVTVRIRHAPWRDALAAIVQTQGWTVRDDGGVIRLHARREDSGGSTATGVTVAGRSVELLRFFHIAPDDMKKAVAPLFAGAADKPVMSVDERTGSLMVKGVPGDIDLIASLAEKLDQPVQQILIETFIIEAGRGLERSLGARLGIDRFDAGGVIRVGGVIGDAGRTAVDLPVAAPAAGLGFLFDGDRLKLELTALEKEGKTRIVSNPRIFTLNGREAVIFQGDEVPYFSVSENGTQTEFKEAGVRLAVTPAIVGDGNLILDVTVNKDTVDTRVQNPPITRRQIKTKLLVADGAMVIIGGIYFDTRVNTETRVPVLGRLPVIGRLFKRSQDTRDLKELLVFIAPKIVGASS